MTAEQAPYLLLCGVMFATIPFASGRRDRFLTGTALIASNILYNMTWLGLWKITLWPVQSAALFSIALALFIQNGGRWLVAVMALCFVQSLVHVGFWLHDDGSDVHFGQYAFALNLTFVAMVTCVAVDGGRIVWDRASDAWRNRIYRRSADPVGRAWPTVFTDTPNGDDRCPKVRRHAFKDAGA